jgi:hypothetical protein
MGREEGGEEQVEGREVMKEGQGKRHEGRGMRHDAKGIGEEEGEDGDEAKGIKKIERDEGRGWDRRRMKGGRNEKGTERRKERR